MSSFASQNTASFGYPVPDPAAVSRPGRLEFYDPSPNMTGMPPPPSLAALGRQLTFDGDDEDEAELFLFDARPPPPGSDMFLDGRGMLSHFSSLEETTRFSLPTPGTPSTLRRFRRSASQHLHEEDSDFMMSDAPPPACLRAGLLHPLRPTNFDLRYGAQGGLSAPQTINSAVSSPLCTQNPSQETTTTSSSFDQLGPAAFSYEPTFEVAYFTHRGPRSSQEDRVFFSYVGNHPKTYFACVYDGHNGADAAEFAMNHLHNVVSNEVTYSTDLSVALVDGIRRTDIMLRESNMDNGSGSTVLVACVRGNALTIANLGDCRAVMGFKDGTAVPLTVDHRAGQETEQQRVQRHRDAARLEGFSVTRGLADFHVKPPEGVLSGNCALSNVADITTCTLDPSCEFVLLASDGLWDRVSNEYAVAYLHAEFAKQGARSRRLSLDSDDDGAGVDPCSPCDTPRAGACNAVRGLVHSVVDQASDNMTAVCLRFV